MIDSEGIRLVVAFDSEWRFSKGDPPGAHERDFDDSNWEVIDVPHDWAIEGPFDRNNDIHWVAITEDGETIEKEHLGRTGGLPHVGVAWYRKSFSIPGKHSGKTVSIEFDGIMSNSSVYLNDEFVGTWPYGYSSFCFDLTDKIRFGGTNLLAVRIDSLPLAARWYPGAGIYRHVRMVLTNPIHVAHWGTYIVTRRISGGQAMVSVRTEVQNDTGMVRAVSVRTGIFDDSETEVAEDSISSVIRVDALYSL